MAADSPSSYSTGGLSWKVRERVKAMARSQSFLTPPTSSSRPAVQNFRMDTQALPELLEALRDWGTLWSPVERAEGVYSLEAIEEYIGEKIPVIWAEQDWFLPRELVGNGPFVMESWRVNDRIRLRPLVILEQTRPNPFRDATTISCVLTAPGEVDIRVYDVAGMLVRTLSRGHRPAGRYDITWDGSSTARMAKSFNSAAPVQAASSASASPLEYQPMRVLMSVLFTPAALTRIKT